MKRYANREDIRDMSHVDDLDLSTLSREDLIALKLELLDTGASLREQHDEACARTYTAGESPDHDRLHRLRRARSACTAKVQRVDLRLGALRQETKDVNSKAAVVIGSHLQYLHAFHALAKELLDEIGPEAFSELAQKSRSAVESGHLKSRVCSRCREQRIVEMKEAKP